MPLAAATAPTNVPTDSTQSNLRLMRLSVEVSDMPREAPWLMSFLQSGLPVHDKCYGRRRRLFDQSVDEKSLAVRGDVVRIVAQRDHGARTHREQRPHRTHLEVGALAIHRCRSQRVIGRQVDNLFSVASPSRPQPSGRRDSPPFARFRESSNIDLELPRLVGYVRDPSPVRRKSASGFNKRAFEKRKRLLISEQRQDQQIASRYCRSPCYVHDEPAVGRPVRGELAQTALQ